MSRFSAVYTEHLIHSIIGFLDIRWSAPLSLWMASYVGPPQQQVFILI